MVSCALLAARTSPLVEAGISYGVFSDTVPDPTPTVVEAGVEAFKAGGYDGLIGFGGGTPREPAKAMKWLAAPGAPRRDHNEPNGVGATGVSRGCLRAQVGLGPEGHRIRGAQRARWKASGRR